MYRHYIQCGLQGLGVASLDLLGIAVQGRELKFRKQKKQGHDAGMSGMICALIRQEHERTENVMREYG